MVAGTHFAAGNFDHFRGMVTAAAKYKGQQQKQQSGDSGEPLNFVAFKAIGCSYRQVIEENIFILDTQVLSSLTTAAFIIGGPHI